MKFRSYKDEKGSQTVEIAECTKIRFAYEPSKNKLYIKLYCINPNTVYQIEIEDDDHEYFHGVLQSQNDYSFKKYDDIHKFYKEYMDQCFGINKRAFDHNLILYKYEMDKRGNLHHTLEILL